MSSARPTPPTAAASWSPRRPPGAALLKRLRKRKNAYLAQAACASLDPDEVETLERAAEILERLLEGESAA